jgi:hypothetical protein
MHCRVSVSLVVLHRYQVSVATEFSGTDDIIVHVAVHLVAGARAGSRVRRQAVLAHGAAAMPLDFVFLASSAIVFVICGL